MSVSQDDTIEFYCKTVKDAKKIVSYLQALSKLQKDTFGSYKEWPYNDIEFVIGGLPISRIDYPREIKKILTIYMHPRRAWNYKEHLHFFDIFLGTKLCEGILFKSITEYGQVTAYSNKEQTNPWGGWQSARIDMEKWCEDNDIDCSYPEDEDEADGWEDPKFDDDNIQAAIDDAEWVSGLDPDKKEDDEDLW